MKRKLMENLTDKLIYFVTKPLRKMMRRGFLRDNPRAVRRLKDLRASMAKDNIPVTARGRGVYAMLPYDTKNTAHMQMGPREAAKMAPQEWASTVQHEKAHLKGPDLGEYRKFHSAYSRGLFKKDPARADKAWDRLTSDRKLAHGMSHSKPGFLGLPNTHVSHSPLM